MELISNLFQFAVTLLGFCMSGIRYLKDRKQIYFLLTCFYGCFALGSLYWTLYLCILLYFWGCSLQSALVWHDDHCFLSFYPGSCLCADTDGNSV